MVYPALLPLMRTPLPPVVDSTDAPRRFKWTRPFRRKTKSGFCACAITFQTQSTFSTNMRLLFFHKFSTRNTLFTPLRDILYARSVKLFAETSELFMHAVFRLVVVRKTVSSECILQGVQEDGSRRVLNKYFTGMRTWYIFLFVWILRIPCFNIFNARTFLYELTEVPLFKNSTDTLTVLGEVSRGFTHRSLHSKSILRRPPYSLVLVPFFDLHIFGALKDNLRGRRFTDDGEYKRNVDEELRRFSQGFHATGIQRLTRGGKACWWWRLCGNIISTL
jgi:hypothetical protein